MIVEAINVVVVMRERKKNLCISNLCECVINIKTCTEFRNRQQRKKNGSYNDNDKKQKWSLFLLMK